ncbi:MAG: hypothetical protein B7X99_15770 [Rhizobiales bacterium 17-65-6]|jgi:hypothetical protein|nr:MAG: hypothetical protein B7X99_15770 [Rhizobiales bacterium 17-65-6]OZB11215.1 MAG: hypothetical protein B7X67_04895 [Rhizobiales bacterium 39-66-18]
MTPDASGWRSPDGYQHIETMNSSDLAWEWLRRNEAYDEDFLALTDGADPNPLTERIRQRWGLRFRRGPVACPAPSATFVAPRGRHKRYRTRRGARSLLRNP